MRRARLTPLSEVALGGTFKYVLLKSGEARFLKVGWRTPFHSEMVDPDEPVESAGAVVVVDGVVGFAYRDSESLGVRSRDDDLAMIEGLVKEARK